MKTEYLKVLIKKIAEGKSDRTIVAELKKIEGIGKITEQAVRRARIRHIKEIAVAKNDISNIPLANLKTRIRELQDIYKQTKLSRPKIAIMAIQEIHKQLSNNPEVTNINIQNNSLCVIPGTLSEIEWERQIDEKLKAIEIQTS